MIEYSQLARHRYGHVHQPTFFYRAFQGKAGAERRNVNQPRYLSPLQILCLPAMYTHG
jgi:hypothetical protein